ncbi:hypothetical protein [Variovorax saccharolyticus]|uniref:hypothetical protein n=1 Tax=Variovorax saccharolyticus TaxID=3053516 RepID=UPI002575BC7B|nr:hypothetical protein [Variovorax sp. J31P216]MDM0030071.1 hypothetical protein [Variovorax sp. J31P216]
MESLGLALVKSLDEALDRVRSRLQSQFGRPVLVDSHAKSLTQTEVQMQDSNLVPPSISYDKPAVGSDSIQAGPTVNGKRLSKENSARLEHAGSALMAWGGATMLVVYLIGSFLDPFDQPGAQAKFDRVGYGGACSMVAMAMVCLWISGRANARALLNDTLPYVDPTLNHGTGRRPAPRPGSFELASPANSGPSQRQGPSAEAATPINKTTLVGPNAWAALHALTQRVRLSKRPVPQHHPDK